MVEERYDMSLEGGFLSFFSRLFSLGCNYFQRLLAQRLAEPCSNSKSINGQMNGFKIGERGAHVATRPEDVGEVLQNVMAKIKECRSLSALPGLRSLRNIRADLFIVFFLRFIQSLLKP